MMGKRKRTPDPIYQCLDAGDVRNGRSSGTNFGFGVRCVTIKAYLCRLFFNV